MSQNNRKLFESFYDVYSSRLYGFIMELSHSKNDADIILCNTFKKACSQNLAHKQSNNTFTLLVKLAVETACEHHLQKGQISSPDRPGSVLHKLLMEHNNAETPASQGRLAMGRIVREKFQALRAASTKDQ